MPRPKSHFRANGLLKPTAPLYHTSKPDLTKLMRSTEDALTGICWTDDSSIARQSPLKLYSNDGLTGATIEVTTLEGKP